MAGSAIDVGRGARRFALPGGMTVGEGWVNDPRQAYNFSKAGIAPQDTGELEGVHGEGVAGAVPGLGGGPRQPALSGLRSAMGGGDDDAPGASLMRRLTATPASAATHGLIEDPETVAARNAAMQRGYAAPDDPAKTELRREDIQHRGAFAMQGLRESLADRNANSEDYDSERAQERLTLPFAQHNRANAQSDLLSKLEKQYLEPEAVRSETAGYTADATLAGHQATAHATESSAALRALSALIDSSVKSQSGGSGAIDDATLKAQIAQLLQRIR